MSLVGQFLVSLDNADNAAEYAVTGVDVLVTSWVYFGKPQDIKMEFTAAR